MVSLNTENSLQRRTSFGERSDILVRLRQEQQPFKRRYQQGSAFRRGEIGPKIATGHAFGQAVPQSIFDAVKKMAQPHPETLAALVMFGARQSGGEVTERTACELMEHGLNVAYLLKQPLQALLRPQRRIPERLPQHGLELGDLPLQHLESQLLFGLEVVIEVALGNAAAHQDIVYAGGLVADIVEHLAGALQDLLSAARLARHKKWLPFRPALR